MNKYKVPKKKYEMCKRIGKMYCPITDRCRDSNSYRKKCLDEMKADYYYDKKNRITPYLADRGDYYSYIDEEINELPYNNEEFIDKNEIQPHIEKISKELNIDHKTLYQNLENLIEVLRQGNINTVSELKELNDTLKENGIVLKNLILNKGVSQNVQNVPRINTSNIPIDDYVSPIWEGRKAPPPPPPPPSPEEIERMNVRSNASNMLQELKNKLANRGKIEGSGMYGGYYPGYYYDNYYSHFINGKYVN